MPGQQQAGTQQAQQAAAAPQQQPQADPNGAALQPQPAAQPAPAAQPNGGGDGEEHWKAMARRWEDQSKANKAEADQAQAALAEANRQLAVMRTAAEAGVSAEVLGKMAGTTDDEIKANAALLSQAMGAQQQADPNGAAPRQSQEASAQQPAARPQPNPYPQIPDFGATAAHATTREEIEGIKDPAARVMARAGNVGLYQ